MSAIWKQGNWRKCSSVFVEAFVCYHDKLPPCSEIELNYWLHISCFFWPNAQWSDVVLQIAQWCDVLLQKVSAMYSQASMWLSHEAWRKVTSSFSYKTGRRSTVLNFFPCWTNWRTAISRMFYTKVSWELGSEQYHLIKAQSFARKQSSVSFSLANNTIIHCCSLKMSCGLNHSLRFKLFLEKVSYND